MGGNALKNIKTMRKDKVEYSLIKEKIKNILLEKGISIDFSPELEDKESFGDLDVLYIPNSNIIMKDIIIELFSPNEMVINGDVISFDYENFQIDMVKCSNIEFNKLFFSYGDFGNLIGKIIKKYGFTFEHDCLTTIFENHKIILTKDVNEFCNFINIDLNKWKLIKTKYDLFELVKSSRFFIKEIFNSGNHEHRRCLNNRPLYLEFINSIGIDEDNKEESLHLTIDEKFGFFNEAIEYFNKKEEIEYIKIKLERNKIINSKFNGNMLKERGFSGVEIGNIIRTFKKKYEDFDTWIYENNKHEIMSSLEDVIKELNIIKC